jgi:hypothetical protein
MVYSESGTQSATDQTEVRAAPSEQQQDIGYAYQALNIRDDLTEKYLSNMQNMDLFDKLWKN